MSDLPFRAMLFARDVHANQRRKYTDAPYTEHLAEVAGIVATVDPWSSQAEVTIATAWLHDCVEDQGVTIPEIREKFGHLVALGVEYLTDCEVGNRAERKAAACIRLAAAPRWVQNIKCADLISNTTSIVRHDPKFAKVYLREKRELLAVLTEANFGLHVLAARAAAESNIPED